MPKIKELIHTVVPCCRTYTWFSGGPVPRGLDALLDSMPVNPL